MANNIYSIFEDYMNKDQNLLLTKQDQQVHKKLIELLRKNKHNKYADRFEKMYVQVVPLDPKVAKAANRLYGNKNNDDFTCAISFATNTILISEGFLNNEATFSQLDMLMRHELAHNLMMHEIRLIHKWAEKDEEFADHIKESGSFHDLMNIIEDFEISHSGRYTDADKLTVRNTILNGRQIKGLLTEDHRASWLELTLEDMYDKLVEELLTCKHEIANYITNNRIPNDIIKRNAASIMANYSDIDSLVSEIYIPMEDFMKSKIFTKLLSNNARKITEDIYKNLVVDKHGQFSKSDISSMLNAIKDSTPAEIVDIKYPPTDEIIATVYTPEEKGLAIELLKNAWMFKDIFTEWYIKIYSALSSKSPDPSGWGIKDDYSNDDLDKAIKELK